MFCTNWRNAFIDRLISLTIIAFFICFFLGAVMCTIALVLVPGWCAYSENLFAGGLVCMLLVCPVILTLGFFLVLFVEWRCTDRASTSPHENKEIASHLVVWKLY